MSFGDMDDEGNVDVYPTMGEQAMILTRFLQFIILPLFGLLLLIGGGFLLWWLL